MKKTLTAVLIISLAAISFLFTGCFGNSDDELFRVAMITDSGDITDQSYNQTTYTACKSFCDNNGIQFIYYKPEGKTNADRVASIEQAIKDKYDVLVLPGFLFAESIIDTADRYPDIKFIGLDISEEDLLSYAAERGKENWEIKDNIFCAVYNEEIPGFMAGYAAVKEGYRHLGFLGGIPVPAVVKYGYGYLQGVNRAAIELGVADRVTVEYVYGGQFFADPKIQKEMTDWYFNKGVQVVFACGGSIWNSAIEGAKGSGGKIIGVDIDQSPEINKFGAGLCLTSATKGLTVTVESILNAILEECWDVYAGNVQALGLISGTDVTENYVQLPVDTWSMKNFTIPDYLALVNKIYIGDIVISNDITKMPKLKIKVNKYPNIK